MNYNRTFNFFNILLLAVFGFTFASGTLSARQDEPQQKAVLVDEEEAPKDTTELREIDTMKVFPSQYHGRVSSFKAPSAAIIIDKHDANFDNYYNVSDIIEKKAFSYSYKLGFPGQSSYLSFNGGMPMNNSVRYNNSPLFTPEYSQFDVDFIAPEFYEKIEILNGSQAAILSGKSTMINFSERKFNTAKPFTKMWYTQSGYGIIGAEGVFSQNFHPKWNIALGFKNLGGDGRFENSETNHWNVHGVLRYNPDDLSSVSLSYNFNNHFSRLNGGINRDLSESTSELDAVVYFTNLNDRIFRNDITMTYSTQFDTNKTSFMTANLFYSNNETIRRYQNVPLLMALDSSARSVYYSNYIGTNILFETKIGSILSLKSGADLSFVDMDKTLLSKSFSAVNYDVYASLAAELFDGITVSGGVRYERFYDNDLPAFGANFTWNIDNSSTFFVDGSVSELLPSLIQGLDKAKETHYLGIVGFKNTGDGNEFSFQLFARRINNPLMSEISMDGNYVVYSDDCDCNNRDIFGGEIRYKSKLFGLIHYDIALNSYYSLTNAEYDELFPIAKLFVNAYYEYNIGKSIFRGGLESIVGSPLKGMRFYPITKDFLTYDKTGKWTGNGLDAYVSLRLGNAFLRLSFENILSQIYYTTNYYPMTDRMFHLSVSWAFDD